MKRAEDKRPRTEATLLHDGAVVDSSWSIGNDSYAWSAFWRFVKEGRELVDMRSVVEVKIERIDPRPEQETVQLLKSIRLNTGESQHWMDREEARKNKEDFLPPATRGNKSSRVGKKVDRATLERLRAGKKAGKTNLWNGR